MNDKDQILDAILTDIKLAVLDKDLAKFEDKADELRQHISTHYREVYQFRTAA